MRNFTSNTRTLFVLLLITISFIVLPLVTSAMLQVQAAEIGKTNEIPPVRQQAYLNEEEFIRLAHDLNVPVDILVPPGSSVQAALDISQPGDAVVLQANADYPCSCTLPVKSGASHITIKSSRADEISGRVNPATQSVLLARVRSGHPSEPAFATVPGAHHYTLLGLDAAPKSDGQAFHAIRFGDTGTNQDTLDEVPHNLAIDRSWIHGAPTQDIQRGITLNSASTQIINSYISEIHYKGVESQAIAGWNGPGPYRIENNYLEGAGINIIFGGAVPSISGLIPSDILITGNTIYKPPSWRGVWTAKNLFELKSARRVTFTNNTLENSWVDAQIGWAIILNTTGDSGSWNVIEDVTIVRNIIRNAANGINIRGLDDPCDVLKMRRIIVADNLLENIGAFDGAGRLFQLIQGSEDVSIIHNTGVGTHSFLTVEKCGAFSHTRLIVQDNLSTFGEYGVFASGGAVGTAALNNNATNWAFQKNAIYGRPGVNTSAYPPDNFFPADLTSASMIIGTDGKRVGVRLDVTPSPTPTPTATPTPVSSPSPSPSPTGTPTPTPSPTPSPTPEPTPSQCSISAPSSVTVPQWTSGQLSVNVSNLTAPIEVIAESGSGQVSAVPYSRTVNGTSAILAYEIRVKRKSSAVTFKSPCGERVVQVVVR